MTDAVNILKGHRAKVLEFPDQLTLEMDHGWVLAIYSRFSLKSSSGSQLAVSSIDNGLVVDTITSDQAITIIFDNDAALSVDLSGSQFIGPEAMQLCGPNEEIIIWN